MLYPYRAPGETGPGSVLHHRARPAGAEAGGACRGAWGGAGGAEGAATAGQYIFLSVILRDLKSLSLLSIGNNKIIFRSSECKECIKVAKKVDSL